MALHPRSIDLFDPSESYKRSEIHTLMQSFIQSVSTERTYYVQDTINISGTGISTSLISSSHSATETQMLPSHYNTVWFVPWHWQSRTRGFMEIQKRNTQCRFEEPQETLWTRSEEWQGVTAWGDQHVCEPGGGERRPCCRDWDNIHMIAWSAKRDVGSSAQLLCFTAGVDTPRPRSQIWPTPCICTACKLRMDFTFLNGWQNSSKEEYVIACGNHMKFEFQHPHIKCSSNTVMHTCFWMVAGWLRSKSRVE